MLTILFYCKVLHKLFNIVRNLARIGLQMLLGAARPSLRLETTEQRGCQAAAAHWTQSRRPGGPGPTAGAGLGVIVRC